MAKEYPGRPFTDEDLEALRANNSTRANYSEYNYNLRKNEPVIYNPHGFDVDPSELPEHHMEVTQISLKKLCNIIGGYFKQMFVDFAGCQMRSDPQNGRPEIGFLVFNLVFEWQNGYSEPNKFNALVRYDRPADTIIELQKRWRTLELTPEAKGFLMKYMSNIEYDSKGKPFVNWAKYQEEKDLQGRSASGYNITSNMLVLTCVDLNKIVQDIWTNPAVKHADEEAAIKNWKRSHWKLIGKNDKQEEEYETGPETDDEILAMMARNINRKYVATVQFKGYQRLDPNGNPSFSFTPLNVAPTGQMQQSVTHDFDKYWVNIRISNTAQIAHDFPLFSSNSLNNSDFLLNLI